MLFDRSITENRCKINNNSLNSLTMMAADGLVV
jgi:hypothetical protein